VRGKWAARKSALQSAWIEKLEQQLDSLAKTLDAVIDQLVASGNLTKSGLEKIRVPRSSARKP